MQRSPGSSVAEEVAGAKQEVLPGLASGRAPIVAVHCGREERGNGDLCSAQRTAQGSGGKNMNGSGAAAAQTCGTARPCRARARRTVAFAEPSAKEVLMAVSTGPAFVVMTRRVAFAGLPGTSAQAGSALLATAPSQLEGGGGKESGGQGRKWSYIEDR
jgi:hypothetical protein